jgi:hypothetical protein
MFFHSGLNVAVFCRGRTSSDSFRAASSRSLATRFISSRVIWSIIAPGQQPVWNSSRVVRWSLICRYIRGWVNIGSSCSLWPNRR